MTVPSDSHAVPDQDQGVDCEYILALAGTLVCAAICLSALLQARQDHGTWVHIFWVALAGITGVLAFVGMIFTFLASDWYAKPLPRTDPDNPRPPFPDSDQRTY